MISSLPETDALDRQWSADFVEHIRTIHFALITISLSIATLLVGSKELRFEKAMTQSEQIEDLKRNWEDVRRSIYLAAAKSIGVDFESRLGILVINCQSLLKDFRFEDTAFDASESTASLPFHTGTLVDLPLGTLGEFRALWDTLGKGVSLHIPRFTESPSTMPDGKLRNNCKVNMTKNYRQGPGDTAMPCLCLRGDASDADSRVMARWKKNPFPSGKQPEFQLVMELMQTKSDPSTAKATSIVALYDSVEVFLNQEVLVQRYSDWRTGPYVNAFRELADASAEFENIPIESVFGRVKGMEAKGDQVMEAFGIRLPSAQVTRWGTLLLLAVQFYFGLHLHQLLRNLRPTDPGWNVAWIGVYRSPIALVTSFATACMIPLAVVCVVAPKVKVEGYPFWNTPISVSLIVFSVVLALLAGKHLFLLYRRRTKNQIGDGTPRELPDDHSGDRILGWLGAIARAIKRLRPNARR